MCKNNYFFLILCEMSPKFGVFFQNAKVRLQVCHKAKNQLVSPFGLKVIIQHDIIGGSDIGCSDDAIFVYVHLINLRGVDS